MVEYKCQDCGDQIGFLSADELQRYIAKGEVVKASRRTRQKNLEGVFMDNHEEGYWGVCRSCRQAHAMAPLQGPDPEFARHKRIMERIAHIRRNNPEMSIEEAAMRATEDEYEPHNEPNPAFRAWLLENTERDKTRDADVAATFDREPEA